ncbi:MAG: cytochrome B [Bacteroidia bacterium]|nr:cytochrome B [Bacteroidia bacterium]
MRWIILITAVIAVITYLTGLLKEKEFSKGADRIGLIFTIVMDIQLLTGLYLYFKSAAFQSLTSDFGATMKSTYLRFFGIEHLIGMLIALILVHAGRSRVKKYAESGKKYRIGLIFYALALIIMLAMIPWPFRHEIAKPWFPGMPL